MFFTLVCSSSILAKNYEVVVQGITEEVIDSSHVGILIGMRLDNGTILTPSFTVQDLEDGVFTKTITLDENTKIESCESNWLLSKGKQSIVPESFSNQSIIEECVRQDDTFTIKPKYEISTIKINLPLSSMEKRNAAVLILSIEPISDTGDDFIGGQSTHTRNKFPGQISYRVFTEGFTTFKLKAMWLTKKSKRIVEHFDLEKSIEFTLE